MLNSVLAVMLAMSLLGSMRPAMKLSMDLAIGSGRLFLASLAADLMPSVIGFLDCLLYFSLLVLVLFAPS